MNYEINKQLLTLPDVSITNPIIAQEHSVLNPMPFLARRFPEAKFVLIITRGGLQVSDEQRLAKKLNEILKPGDLVIASVDFSHYKDLARAQEEDAQSIAVLQKNDPQKLESIPADSPASLFVAMTYAKLRGAEEPTIINHKNSVDFTNQPNDPSTTSYITGVWEK
jgi:AmmeMemoRadiSam system protein B